MKRKLDTTHVRRRTSHQLLVVWMAAVLALACCATAVAVSTVKVGGTWTGHYSGPYSGHFTIHWNKKGSGLHGTITLSSPKGKYGISGSVRHGKIKFGAVSVGAKYKGTLRGTSMSGTWISPSGGGSWSATKS